MTQDTAAERSAHVTRGVAAPPSAAHEPTGLEYRGG
jgi:hypothetical protein